MNKKIFLIVTALLAVSLVATPLLVGARKSKAPIMLVAYDLQMVSSETKECGRFTVHTSQWLAQIMVLGTAVEQGMLPMYGGTSEAIVTKKYDPETGFGTSKTCSTWDFGESGSFKVYGRGKCGGVIPTPGGPILGWFAVESLYGFGRDALKGTRLRLASGWQTSLPPVNGLLPPDFIGTAGLWYAGEIIY